MGSPQETKSEPDAPGDDLKDFLKGAPVPGKQWDDADEEDVDDFGNLKAPASKTRKQVGAAGALAGEFDTAPVKTQKHERDEIGETSEEPPAKTARTSLTSLLANLPAPKTAAEKDE